MINTTGRIGPGGEVRARASRFRRWFWQPPRAHGESVDGRRVSFLELFYDLVYVVVLARAARTLAGNVSWRGFFEFVVIFGMLWMAWMFGTIYHEFHGREDGRTRLFVFVQMILLALLAVFTGEAAGESGAPFAITYTSFLVVLILLWQRVRRRDAKEFMEAAGRYQIGMLVSVALLAMSAGLPTDFRLVVWFCFVIAWIVGVGGAILSPSQRFRLGVTATSSLAERFGLFVIIVLGEVVVGVVDGLSKAGQGPRSIATGMLGLMVGFAYWWTYFDFVGRRLPRDSAPSLAGWIYGHLPVTLSIAAAGAAMVSLVEHAEGQRTPIGAAWLLASSVSIGMLGLVLKIRTTEDYRRLESVYQPVSVAMTIAAGAALLAGWWRPAPWLLALTLIVVLAGTWLFAVDRWLRLEESDQMVAPSGRARSEALLP